MKNNDIPRNSFLNTLPKFFKICFIIFIIIMIPPIVSYKFYKYEHYEGYKPAIQIELDSFKLKANSKTIEYLTCAIEPKIENSMLVEMVMLVANTMIFQKNFPNERQITTSTIRRLVSAVRNGSSRNLEWHFTNIIFSNNFVDDFGKEALINYSLNTSYYLEGKSAIGDILNLEKNNPDNIEDEILKVYLRTIRYYKSEKSFIRKLNKLKSGISEKCNY